MGIKGLANRELFKTTKSEYFFPAKAISDASRLQGRNKELRSVEKALASDGRQCFIYGERGVGKTSLAKTAYRENFGERHEVLLVGCEESSSFSSIIRAIIEKGLRDSPIRQETSWRKKFGIKTGVFDAEFEKKVSEGKIPEISDVNQAIHVLSYVVKTRNFPPAVIIDEFDRITSDSQRTRFADFLKQVSDQDLKLKFIFCGISKDIESLIGAHLSTGRYIAPIELDRLNYSELWAIIKDACTKVSVEIDDEYLLRASQIADGYPYFMHLLGDCLFWSLQNAPYETEKVRLENFNEAVSEAVVDAEPILKEAYDKATKKYDKIYEHILWAAAGGTHLPRKYQDSYKIYKDQVAPKFGEDAVSEKRFYDRMLALTRSEFGEILQTNKNGWYSFRENVVRSYVRLRASQGGIDFGTDLLKIPTS
jgi:hypothetical protein